MDVSKTLDCASIEEQDLVSRYVGRKLSPEEAEAFEEHYFACDRCWAEVQQGTEVRAALREEKVSAGAVRVRPRRISPVWGALAVAAAVALAIGGILLRSKSGSKLEDLASAASGLSYRQLEARLTGPFQHRPLQPVTRGKEKPLPVALRHAALEAQMRAQNRRSIETLRAAGLGHLLLGEWNEAITRLEEAKRVEPQNPLVLSDLAAAYYSRAQHLAQTQEPGRSVPDLDLALRYVTEALTIEPRLPEALFNRALVLEASGLRRRAAEAWKAYLEVDGTSPWSEEARNRLKTLEAATDSRLWQRDRSRLHEAAIKGDSSVVGRIVFRFTQYARIFVEEELLPAWADAQASGNQTLASRHLIAARVIADSSARMSGDFMAKDSIDIVDRALSERDSDRIDALIQGHRLYREGQLLYQRRLNSRAAPLFDNAYSLLSNAGSPFRALPRLALARCAFNDQDFSRCLANVEAAQAVAEGKPGRYLSLLAYVRWLQALTRLAQGFPNESFDSYRESLTAFEVLHETENAGAVETRIAENLAYLGEYEQAWTHRLSGLALVNQVGPSPRLSQGMGDAARAALREGYPNLALRYHDELVDLALRQSDSPGVADAFLWRSLARLSAGRSIDAARDLADAKHHCLRISDAALRHRVEANIRVAEAKIEARSNPTHAIRSLDSALEYFKRTENHFRIAELNLERGGFYLAKNEPGLARSEFLAGIQELEAQRSRVRDRDLRISYFETAQRLFDELIRLLVAQGEISSAQAFADEARARVLLDAVGSHDYPAGFRKAGFVSVGGSIPRAAISAELPEDVAVVDYYVLKDRLLAWTLRRSGIALTQTQISSERLKDLTGRVTTVDGGQPRLDRIPTAAALYDALIRPLSRLLQTQRTIVLVPDKFLNAVPFAALWNRQTNRYLIEDYSIGVSPSTSFFARGLRSKHVVPRFESSTAVIIGNPRLSGDGWAPLRSLPGASHEVARIASYYPQALILKDADATKSRFLREASAHRVVHFAGHAIANLDNPSLSSLLFAPDPSSGDSGALYAHELSGARFLHTQLVILAACEAARGRSYDLEGVGSLARSFLLAGIPTVVASIWPVADEPTALLFDIFHRRLKAGDAPIQALRAAQLALLRNPDPAMQAPAQWAPFQVIGSIL
jgi:CHAT domain-containing protein